MPDEWEVSAMCPRFVPPSLRYYEIVDWGVSSHRHGLQNLDVFCWNPGKPVLAYTFPSCAISKRNRWVFIWNFLPWLTSATFGTVAEIARSRMRESSRPLLSVHLEEAVAWTVFMRLITASTVAPRSPSFSRCTWREQRSVKCEKTLDGDGDGGVRSELENRFSGTILVDATRERITNSDGDQSTNRFAHGLIRIGEECPPHR